MRFLHRKRDTASSSKGMAVESQKKTGDDETNSASRSSMAESRYESSTASKHNLKVDEVSATEQELPQSCSSTPSGSTVTTSTSPNVATSSIVSTTATAHSSAPSPHLLHIPLELRYQIFATLLATPCDIYIVPPPSRSQSPTAKKSKTKARNANPVLQTLDSWSQFRTPLGHLSNTCSQLRFEVETWSHHLVSPTHICLTSPSTSFRTVQTPSGILTFYFPFLNPVLVPVPAPIPQSQAQTQAQTTSELPNQNHNQNQKGAQAEEQAEVTGMQIPNPIIYSPAFGLLDRDNTTFHLLKLRRLGALKVLHEHWEWTMHVYAPGLQRKNIETLAMWKLCMERSRSCEVEVLDSVFHEWVYGKLWKGLDGKCGKWKWGIAKLRLEEWRGLGWVYCFRVRVQRLDRFLGRVVWRKVVAEQFVGR